MLRVICRPRPCIIGILRHSNKTFQKTFLAIVEEENPPAKDVDNVLEEEQEPEEVENHAPEPNTETQSAVIESENQ